MPKRNDAEPNYPAKTLPKPATAAAQNISEEKPLTETQVFVCTICGQASTDICVSCTKDTCENHLCPKCLCCSDCCVCEMTRTTQ